MKLKMHRMFMWLVVVALTLNLAACTRQFQENPSTSIPELAEIGNWSWYNHVVIGEYVYFTTARLPYGPAKIDYLYKFKITTSGLSYKTKIPVGNSPRFTGYDGTRYLMTGNYGYPAGSGTTATVIDTWTDTNIATITGIHYGAIVPIYVNGYWWINSTGTSPAGQQGAINKIDPTTWTVVNQYLTPSANIRTAGMDYDPASGLLWVTTSTGISTFDMSTGQWGATSLIPTYGIGSAYGSIWATGGGSTGLFRIDPLTKSVITFIDTAPYKVRRPAFYNINGENYVVISSSEAPNNGIYIIRESDNTVVENVDSPLVYDSIHPAGYGPPMLAFIGGILYESATSKGFSMVEK